MIERSVAEELLPGESVVWSEQPDASKLLGPEDAFLIPFSLLWGGFSFCWEAGVLGWGPFGNSKNHGTPGFFALWGIPFVVIGCYMIFGRFFYKVWIRKRTFYALTNKRLLIVVNGFSKTLQAQDLSSLSKIDKRQGGGKGGSIFFGPVPARGRNSSLDSGINSASGQMAFYDLKDMNKVFQMIYQEKEGPR